MANPNPDGTERAEAFLEVEFRKKDFLRQALRHASIINESPDLSKEDSNERLALLGDAVLSHSVASNLIKKFPDATGGELTERRQALVNRHALADVAGKLNLGECIELGKGAEQTGGRQSVGILEEALEAVIGAIEMDQGFQAADEFVQRVLGP